MSGFAVLALRLRQRIWTKKKGMDGAGRLA